MSQRFKLALGAVFLAGTVALGTGAFAQNPQTTPTPGGGQQGAQGADHQGMMGNGMMGGPNMMGQMDMAQMNKMMENCDKMMERAAQPPPAGSGTSQQKG